MVPRPLITVLPVVESVARLRPRVGESPLKLCGLSPVPVAAQRAEPGRTPDVTPYFIRHN